MFNFAELTIDAVQNSKKQFINTFITNPELKEAWTDYVDAQTEFLYVAAATGTKVLMAAQESIKPRMTTAFNPLNFFMGSNWANGTAQKSKKS